MLRPVLSALASRWAHSGECVEVEHMVHECTLAAMIGATPVVTAPRNPRPVLLCGAPEERHGLPLYVLRAALAAAGIGTQMLGAALPADALAAAVRRTGPAAVVVWAQLSRAYRAADVFDRVPRTRQRVRLFACGPGWFTTDLPDRVDRLEDVADAVRRIESLVGVVSRARLDAAFGDRPDLAVSGDPGRPARAVARRGRARRTGPVRGGGRASATI